MPPLLSRRAFLCGTAAQFSVPHVLRAETSRFDADVLIVGAGAAGLAAARELQRLGKSFLLVEAKGRIGGRVFTDTSLGLPFDAGASYIHWAEKNPWAEIARKFGVETVDDRSLIGIIKTYEKGRPTTEEERARRRQAFETASRVLDADPQNVPDVSFAERVANDDLDVQAAAGSIARMTLGEEPERVSAQDYARLWTSTDLLVPSGYGTLVARFGEGLDISLRTPVRTIRWDGPGIEAETPKGTIRAEKAIITTSVGVIAAGGIRFVPDLPQRMQAAIGGLGMGALAKIALNFDGNRFGIPRGDLFEAEGARQMFDFECWPFDRDLVIVWMGGDHSRQVASQGEPGAIAIALESFAKIAGESVRKSFVAGRLAALSEDPFMRGSYSHALPGNAAARAILAEPLAERIYFCGEATGGADSGAAMTVGGAFLAGRDTARSLYQKS